MIIAIESASTEPSLALATPDGSILAAAGWRSERGHGRELLPRLVELLRANGLSIGDASAFAVGIGPGSFTGLRVGMSLAKGFAFALGRPIVGVPSLEAWLAAEPEALAALSRAGAREAFLLLRGEAEPLVVEQERLASLVADQVVVAPSELAGAFALRAARSPTAVAGALARLAADRLAAMPSGDDLARLEPVYLRAPRGIGPSMAEVAVWP